jgi:hypothetical protein
MGSNQMLTTTKIVGNERTKEQLSIGAYNLSPNPSSVTNATQINVQVSNIQILSQPTYPSASFGNWSYYEEDSETTPECRDEFGFFKHATGPWHEVPGSRTDYTSVQFIAGGGGTSNVTFSFDVSYQVQGILDYSNLPNLQTFNQIGIQQQGNVSVDKEITTERVEKSLRCYQAPVWCY